ncbi:MAG: hypothetical protein ACKOPE_02510, partial [Novosphingobium sp.]
MDIGQSFQRIVDLRAERGNHRRHLVAHVAFFVLRPDRDRRHRGQRLVGQVAMVRQVLAHRAA